MATSFESVNLHPLQLAILQKIAMSNFYEPYDAQKVQLAAELNKQAIHLDINEPLSILQLLKESMQQLGCMFDAQMVYKYLFDIYRPEVNTEDFEWCNNFCQQLYLVRDDVGAIIDTAIQLIMEKEEQQEELQHKSDYELFWTCICVAGFFLLAILIGSIITN